jgi:hypothetical protein
MIGEKMANVETAIAAGRQSMGKTRITGGNDEGIMDDGMVDVGSWSCCECVSRAQVTLEQLAAAEAGQLDAVPPEARPQFGTFYSWQKPWQAPSPANLFPELTRCWKVSFL